jgi:hypothetical protein
MYANVWAVQYRKYAPLFNRLARLEEMSRTSWFFKCQKTAT